ncbi:hypothetical protein [Paenibacillus kobensis]|uniref:hypothetical protein n=1 Tax=Paenibacillus kobensis TaxID=59841 RepID=UPI000FD86B42|nr:hypothetical protein [Paenibacillus kobensis]
MFKERRFLVGFGAGIIVGGLLLQLMMTAQQEPSELINSDEQLYTKQEVDQLIEKAKKEALTGEDAASATDQAAEDTAAANPSKPVQPSDPDAPSDPAGSADKGKNAEAPQTPKQPDAVQAEQPSQPTADKPDVPAAPDKAADTAPVVIRIEPGMNLTKTAKLLADNGIITSQSKFIAKMKSDKKLVRAGFFAFTGKPTLEQTVDTLTGQPLTEAEANRIKSKS